MTPSGAPVLSESDVREELADIHGKRHRTFTTALFGHGFRGTVALQLDGQERHFEVRPVTCELELRRELAAKAPNRELALLLDFDQPMPLDIAARLAGGKMFSVTRARRLARRFGAAQASPDLVHSPLTDALLALGPDLRSERVRSATLDASTAWAAYLRHLVQFDDTAITELGVVAFAAESSTQEAWIAASTHHLGLEGALLAHLSSLADSGVAAWAWRLWQTGQGTLAAALAFIVDAAGKKRTSGLFRSALRITLGNALPALGKEVEQVPALLDRWGKLAQPLHLRLGAKPAVLRAVLARADEFFNDRDLAPFASESTFLPSALRALRVELAEALSQATRETEVASEAFQRARDALATVRAHSLAAEHKALIDRTTMALRLVAYRSYRQPFEDTLRDAPPQEAFLQLAQHYAEQGGFVDLARQRSRTAESDDLSRTIAREVERADALRDTDDLRFAKALPVWSRERRDSDRAVPIEAALRTHVADFLADQKHRRAVVVLMDGMAWPNAVELLLELERQRFAPLGWRGKDSRWPGLVVPMIAALPTVTEVSRSSFFAGRLLSGSEAMDTSKDPNRFAANSAFKATLAKPPTLLLRDQATTAEGQLSTTALNLIRSDEPLVALVINAVDETLKAGRQVDLLTTPETIKPLGPLLQAATEAGRAVFFAADHGHVVGARLASQSQPGSGDKSRWRPLAAGEKELPHEVALGPDAASIPRGAERVALIATETVTYGKSRTLGEHGGATLAEVIAPAIWVAHESLADAVSDTTGQPADPALGTVPFPKPAWWDLELRRVPRAAAGKPREPRDAQASLPLAVPTARPKSTPGARPVVPALPVQSGTETEVRKALAKAGVLPTQPERQAQLTKRVAALADHGYQMPPPLFASRAEVFEYRVAGTIAEMAESLNVDGYQVISFDKVQNLVRLDRALFEELFGVKL